MQTLPQRDQLDMPIQSLERDEVGGARARFADSHPWRRTLLLCATGGSTAAAAAVMAGLLAPKGFGPADWVMLGLFVVLFAWVAFAFVSATAGFLLAWNARAVSPTDPQPIVFTRTALLMPTYNEDPGRILSGARPSMRSSTPWASPSSTISTSCRTRGTRPSPRRRPRGSSACACALGFPIASSIAAGR